MTNEQIQQALLNLQDQQVRAAWISAGAAIVQAVGAVAAIFATIVLARSSAKREADADARAEERALAAERAAEKRADEAHEAAEARAVAADRAADARLSAAEVRDHNAPIDVVLTLADVAVLDLQAQAEYFDAEVTKGASYGYRLYLSSGTDTVDAIEKARLTIADPVAVLALNALRDALRGSSDSQYGIPDQVADAFRRKAREVQEARDDLRRARREI